MSKPRMPDERRITNRDVAVGLEVHVDGWGTGPFFTVRGFDGDKALLSKRYTNRVKYRVPVGRLYYTNTCFAIASKRAAVHNGNGDAR